jgi:DmsE family decaheme c-type cytochrome
LLVKSAFPPLVGASSAHDKTNPPDPREPSSLFHPPRAASPPGRFRKVLWLPVGIVAAIVVISCANYQHFRELPATTLGSTYVGMDECTQCHEEIFENFRATSHGHMRGDKGESCEACHGPGSQHVEAGEDFIVMPNDANCLACHGGSHKTARGPRHTDRKVVMDWQFSDHKMAGVKCIDCHNPHSTTHKALRAKPEFQVQNIDPASALCLSCHQDILGRISMPYHHPIREGAMGCTDCHNPHGSQKRQLLAKNETCTKCHQAQQGLFAREHQPVAEDCSICHDPHGSPVPKMTRVGQPMLCLQCHSLTHNRHNAVALAGGGKISPAALRDCTACHGAIHGSDIDAYFRH